MKTLYIITFLLFCVYGIQAATIYSKTHTINMPNSDCVIYHTIFYSDMDTPSDVTDDKVVVTHNVLKCKDNFTMVPEDIEDVMVGKDLTIDFEPGIRMIPYREFVVRQTQKDADKELLYSKFKWTEVPINQERTSIKVKPVTD